MAETKKSKKERIEDDLLEYIEHHSKNERSDIAEIISATSMVLVEPRINDWLFFLVSSCSLP